MANSKTMTNHDDIRTWVEERKGRPSKVGTSGDDSILRIDFAEPDDKLEEIEWEEFFEIFEEDKLAFLHQEETSDHKNSRFNKFVSR